MNKEELEQRKSMLDTMAAKEIDLAVLKSLPLELLPYAINKMHVENIDFEVRDWLRSLHRGGLITNKVTEYWEKQLMEISPQQINSWMLSHMCSEQIRNKAKQISYEYWTRRLGNMEPKKITADFVNKLPWNGIRKLAMKYLARYIACASAELTLEFIRNLPSKDLMCQAGARGAAIWDLNKIDKKFFEQLSDDDVCLAVENGLIQRIEKLSPRLISVNFINRLATENLQMAALKRICVADLPKMNNRFIAQLPTEKLQRMALVQLIEVGWEKIDKEFINKLPNDDLKRKTFKCVCALWKERMDKAMSGLRMDKQFIDGLISANLQQHAWEIVNRDWAAYINKVPVYNIDDKFINGLPTEKLKNLARDKKEKMSVNTEISTVAVSVPTHIDCMPVYVWQNGVGCRVADMNLDEKN